jgi:CheY-like chemotaxis protein
MSGFEVLSALKSDPVTQSIDVIIHTSTHLDEAGLRSLQGSLTVLRKDEWPEGDSMVFLASRLREAGRSPF